MHHHPTRPSTCSSSGPARPASPSAGTCSSRTPASCWSTPALASATSGGPAGTRCGCSPPPSTTACRTCRSPAAPGTYPGKDAVADYLEAYAAHVRPAGAAGHAGHPAAAGRRTASRRRRRRAAAPPARSSSPPGPSPPPHIPALGRRSGPGGRVGAQLGYRRPADLPRGRSWSWAPATPGCRSPRSWPPPGGPCPWRSAPGRATVPQRPLGRDLFWWLTRTGLIRATVDSRLGRRLRDRELVIGTTWRGLPRAGRRPASRGCVGASGRTVAFADGSHRRGRRGRLGDRLPRRLGWLDVPGAVVDGTRRARPRGQPGARPVLPRPAVAAHPRLGAARVRPVRTPHGWRSDWPRRPAWLGGDRRTAGLTAAELPP